MSLRARLSTYWCAFQEHLFPTNKTSVPWENATRLELVRNICPVVVACAVARNRIGRRWIAKAVFQMTLPGRCENDRALRRLCGWESIRALPTKRQFAEGALPSRLHEALTRTPCRISWSVTCRRDGDRGA